MQLQQHHPYMEMSRKAELERDLWWDWISVDYRARQTANIIRMPQVNVNLRSVEFWMEALCPGHFPDRAGLTC
jgi:hypothetical protein